VNKVINLYQSNGPMDKLPWLRGIPLEAERPGSVVVINQDIRKDRTDLLEPGLNHFNIEKQTKIRNEVIQQIKQVCLPRPIWAMRKSLPTLDGQSIENSQAPTTYPSQAKLN
jgi:hypothetical protein